MALVINPNAGAAANPTTLRATPDHLSFSQLTKLSRRYPRSCPRAWAYDKRLGLPRGAGVAMILGRALDDAVADFLRRRMLGDSAAKAHDDAIGNIASVIGQSPDWPADRGRVEYVATLQEAFTAFVDEYSELVPAAIQRDHVYEVTTLTGGRRRMVGYSDWIEKDGTIVDLKFSGAPKWNSAGVWYEDWLPSVRDQTCTYYMGRLFAQSVGAGDLFAPVVPRGKVVVVCAGVNRRNATVRETTFTFTDELVAEIADAVREADAAAVSPTHPARPGDACRWCSYVDRCQADQARYVATTESLVAPVTLTGAGR